MDRRDFIKTSPLLALPMILQNCNWGAKKPGYSIEIQSDADTGHLIMESKSFDPGKTVSTETLIVGGGIAGMSAACNIGNKEFVLCELSDQLGGSASAAIHEGNRFSQGALYDFSYPANYGEEVLVMLEELGIIDYQPWKDNWNFTDQQYIILNRRKNRVYAHGEFRKEVLSDGYLKESFLKHISSFRGRMYLPTRLIQEDLHDLNRLSFLNYLSKRFKLTDQFVAEVDYHMRDDYGADCSSVSALAGIHYYACRPYDTEVVELFSPQEGNYYFINKMAGTLPQDQLLTRHLVKKITEDNNGFTTEVVDIRNNVIHTFKTKKIIYAGQKHALKYIYPQGYVHFANNAYAPWMVLNIVIEGSLPLPAFWQNEILDVDPTFLGFVDSAAQHGDPEHNPRILTAFYCLPPGARNSLINVQNNQNQIVATTIERISNYFGMNVEDAVQKVFIKVRGHAMPIPKPGYLFQDGNLRSKNKNMIYAGVDNGRLPLLFEALDSGIQAGKLAVL